MCTKHVFCRLIDIITKSARRFETILCYYTAKNDTILVERYFNNSTHAYCTSINAYYGQWSQSELSTHYLQPHNIIYTRPVYLFFI